MLQYNLHRPPTAPHLTSTETQFGAVEKSLEDFIRSRDEVRGWEGIGAETGRITSSYTTIHTTQELGRRCWRRQLLQSVR